MCELVRSRSFSSWSGWRRLGLGVHPPIGDPPGPRGEQVVERIEELDALRRLRWERLADIAVQPLPFPRLGTAATCRRGVLVRQEPAMDQQAGSGRPRLETRLSCSESGLQKL